MNVLQLCYMYVFQCWCIFLAASRKQHCGEFSTREMMLTQCSIYFVLNFAARFYNFPARSYNFPIRFYNFPASSYSFPIRFYNFPARSYNFPIRFYNFPARSYSFLSWSTTDQWRAGKGDELPWLPLWRFLEGAKSLKPKNSSTLLGVFASQKGEWPRR